MTLDQRKGADGHLRWHRTRRVRIKRATSCTVELQPVIFALDPVAEQRSHAQGRETVRALIAQGNGGAVLLAIEHDMLADDLAVQQAPADLLRPGRDIPGIFQERHRRASARTPSPCLSPMVTRRLGTAPCRAMLDPNS